MNRRVNALSGSIPGEGMVDQLDGAALQALGRLHRRPRGAEVAQHLTRRCDQLAPGGAEDDAAADPMEQLNPELALEIGDRLGERGLRDMQLLCGPAEAVVIDDRQEVLELPRVHARLHPRERN